MKHILPITFLILLVASCGDAPVGVTTNTGTQKMETFCRLEGFTPSLRHTYLLIDEASLVAAKSPEAFVQSNTYVRDLVLAFVDPDRAIASSVSDVRERVSLYVLPVNGGPGNLIFEGCLPGFSAEELETGSESSLKKFFTGGQQRETDESVRLFRQKIVAALVGASAGRDTDSKHELITKGLKATSKFINGRQGLPRVVLLTQQGRLEAAKPAGNGQLQLKGFEDGDRDGASLGQAEFHVFFSDYSASIEVREYYSAYLLARGAQLNSWTNELPGAMTDAPTKVYRFVGNADYPNDPAPIQIRLGFDRNGQLANSWLTLQGIIDRGTPLHGQIVCAIPESCQLTSEGDFAQAWTLEPGGEPEFVGEMPFGGMRRWKLTIDGDRINGEVFDPGVFRVGDNPNQSTIGISGKKIHSAIF